MRLISIIVLAALAFCSVACKSRHNTGAGQTPHAPDESAARPAAGGGDLGDASPDSAPPADSEPSSVDPDSDEVKGASDHHARSAHPSFPLHPSGGICQIQMRNVDFHVDDTVILRIKSLRGALAGKTRSAPPAFDDKHSFIMRIDSGDVGISAASLADVMNNYVFAYPNAPIKRIAISTDGDKIKLKGIVHKVADVHFEIAGGISPTPDGKIRLHPSSIKADGVPVKRLMHLFGLDLAKLIKAGQGRGVDIDDDDLIIDPELIIPAPEIRGKLTAVHIEGDQVVQVYGGGHKVKPLTPYDRNAPNYMYFRGGAIRFGKLTMNDADMQIVDEHPKDPFDFSIDHYNRQLVAGYSKNTPRYGLVVFMPDYYQVK